MSVPPGSWRLLPNYIRANRPWDSDRKKYYSRSIKPYCNQTLGKFVVFPKTEEEFLNSINAMETLWQFPSAFDRVDGCHIPLKLPYGGNEARKECNNFKNFYSVVMMGMVGADYRFLWASAGLPGSVNDACSFQACKLYQNINNGEKLPEIYKTKGIQIPPLILGDLSFHGELKARWRVLYRKCEASQEFLEIKILACIVLRNICIEKGDLITQNLDFTYDSVTDRKRSSIIKGHTQYGSWRICR